MYYLKVVCEVRDKVEVAKHYDLRSGAPGMPREKRRRKTQEEMAAQNRWRRRTRLRRLIEANFGPGDWHVVLGCRKGEELSAIDLFKATHNSKKHGFLEPVKTAIVSHSMLCPV